MQYPPRDQRPPDETGGPTVIGLQQDEVVGRVVRKTSKYPDNGHKEAVRTDQHLAILIDSGRECSGNTYQGDSEAVPEDAALIRTTERGKVQDIGGPRTMECSIRHTNSRVGGGDGVAADALSNLSRSKYTAITKK